MTLAQRIDFWIIVWSARQASLPASLMELAGTSVIVSSLRSGYMISAAASTVRGRDLAGAQHMVCKNPFQTLPDQAIEFPDPGKKNSLLVAVGKSVASL